MSLRILILEDEPPAAAQLAQAVRSWDNEVTIVGIAQSVRRAAELLESQGEPDLILADVRLSDGVVFRLFDRVAVKCPVVFVTAYDSFMIEALDRNAIDYVLKPVEPARLHQALGKYLRLREHFAGRLSQLTRDLSPGQSGPLRILARKVASFVAVPSERIAWFTTEHKLTILVDREGARLAVDQTLGELETQLGRRGFFRLNRQYLVQAEAIARFRGAGKGKILVELSPAAEEEVLVSQDNAAAFRAWIAGGS